VVPLLAALWNGHFDSLVMARATLMDAGWPRAVVVRCA